MARSITKTVTLASVWAKYVEAGGKAADASQAACAAMTDVLHTIAAQDGSGKVVAEQVAATEGLRDGLAADPGKINATMIGVVRQLSQWITDGVLVIDDHRDIILKPVVGHTVGDLRKVMADGKVRTLSTLKAEANKVRTARQNGNKDKNFDRDKAIRALANTVRGVADKGGTTTDKVLADVKALILAETRLSTEATKKAEVKAATRGKKAAVKVA